MASQDQDRDEMEDSPEYLQEVTDVKFQNISIKGYEKKAAGGFTREEYYAYRIVSMYVRTYVCEHVTSATVNVLIKAPISHLLKCQLLQLCTLYVLAMGHV